MAFATIAEMIARYDERVLKDLVQDDNTRNPDISADPTIQAMLDDATGVIEASLRRTYSNDQLAALTAANSAVLIRMNVDLAMGMLYERRFKGIPDQIQGVIDRATDMLTSIRKGDLVLDDAEARIASIPTTHRVLEEESRRDWPLTNSDLYPDFRRDAC